jgi:hypothetical protein
MWRGIVVLVLVMGWNGIAPAQTTKPVCEVVVIGTQHFISDMPEGFTPGHLRALLTKINPDVVAVEAPVNVDRVWDWAPFELAHVTHPFAQEQGWKVEPVGWNEPAYGQQIGMMIQSFDAKEQTTHQKLELKFQRKLNQPTMATCEGMNSEPYVKPWRDYHAALHRMNGGDTPWETLNSKIVENLKTVCAANPGKRVAVVFGAAHAYYLKDALAKADGVKVVEATSYFPLTAAEVEAQTRPVDYVKALRPLNFEELKPETRGAMQAMLKKVEGYPQFTIDFHYYCGKYLLLTGEFAAAVEEFETAGNADEKALSAFDGKTRIGEVARLHAAVARYRGGKKEEGKAGLAAVVKDPKTSEATKVWGRQLLSQM